MLRVILPQNNTALIGHLSADIMQDVCRRIFRADDYQIEYENRRKGRYIKIVDDITSEVHYVCFSNPENDSRNARLMQFVSPTYVDFYKDTATNKHLNIYLLNQSSNDRTDYIKLFYRCFLTIGITILNLQGVTGIVPFNSYEDLKSYRTKISGRNSRNRSTYFTDDDNQVSIYGKTFGANAMESFILGLTLRKIVQRPIVFHPVLDNESVNISTDQQQILVDSGLKYGSAIKLLPSGFARPSRETSRNQSVFKYNLLQKFGDQQCYLCGCNLDHLIIAAHIERVTDIDNSAFYTPEQKAERSTDGDNGLWLCANHDKMFEHGIIYFNGNELKVRSFVTDSTQVQFIKDSISIVREAYSLNAFDDSLFRIRSEHYNIATESYISKHLERHGIVIG